MRRLILAASIGIEAPLEREKISEKLQWNKMHKRTKPLGGFGCYKYFFRGNIVV